MHSALAFEIENLQSSVWKAKNLLTSALITLKTSNKVRTRKHQASCVQLHFAFLGFYNTSVPRGNPVNNVRRLL